MQIQITGHHPLEITEAIREKITLKLQKLTHYFNNITDVHVTLSIENFIHKAVANMHIAKGHLSAHASSKDMYETIDHLVEILRHQITKHKEKIHEFIPVVPNLDQDVI